MRAARPSAMYTWTCKSKALVRRATRRTISVLSVFALAGCVELSALAPGALGVETDAKDQTLKQISLYNDEVVVTAPRGYCIDASQTKRGNFGAFIPIGSCESLTGRSGVPVEPGLITISVLPRQTDRAMPTASDIAASMPGDKVLQTRDGDGLSIVQFATGGARALPGGDARYWRGGMVINGHLLGLAVYGPQGSPLADQNGLRLLVDLAEELRRRSAQTAVDTTPVTRNAARREKEPEFTHLPGALFPNSD